MSFTSLAPSTLFALCLHVCSSLHLPVIKFITPNWTFSHSQCRSCFASPNARVRVSILSFILERLCIWKVKQQELCKMLSLHNSSYSWYHLTAAEKKKKNHSNPAGVFSFSVEHKKVLLNLHTSLVHTMTICSHHICH